jgi:hypothetical protein
MPSRDAFHTARERARPEGLWYMRHEQMLERWPILPEEWARQIEERRLEPLRQRDIAYLHGAGR